MAFTDQLREKWERWTPRERRLVVLLGLTFVLFAFGLVGRTIIKGLSRLETRNAEARQALRLIDETRDELLAQRGQSSPMAAFDAPAPALSTYLETIANDLAIQIVETNPRPDTAKGKFTEKLVEVKLRGVTLGELSEFLKRVETTSQVVVVQRLYVQKSRFGDKEKLDQVELTIAAYERIKGKPAAAGKTEKEEGDDDKEKEGAKEGGGG